MSCRSTRSPGISRHRPGCSWICVQSGRVAPCRAVDLGCGAGNYAVWLALQGFDVTGIDLSAAAVARAQQLARSKGAACRFIVSDLLEPTDAFDASFDFAYDWLVLHHVFPDDRPRYVANVLRLLRPGALYLSVCFSEDDRGHHRRGQVPPASTRHTAVSLVRAGDSRPLRAVVRHRGVDHGGDRGQARPAPGGDGADEEARLRREPLPRRSGAAESGAWTRPATGP